MRSIGPGYLTLITISAGAHSVHKSLQSSRYCNVPSLQGFHHCISLQHYRKLSMTLFSTEPINEPTTSVGLSDIGLLHSNPTDDEAVDTAVVCWRTRINKSIQKSRRIKGGNYVQLATVDRQSLEPRCRTVVFRGFQRMGEHSSPDDSCVMKMITDARSLKVHEVGLGSSSVFDKGNNTVELVWWFSQSSEQYRIRGKLQFISEDTHDSFLKRARIEQWGNLSESAREQFYWESPGLPFQKSNIHIPKGGRDEEGSLLPAPKTFLLMLLHPERCDYLRLSDNYRQIDTLASNNVWIKTQVTP